MHKSATKYNETVGKWCKNKHGASKIIDTLKTYQYPVYTIKVPEGHGFVNRAPVEIFFIQYKDIYNLLNSNRLDYNLVRLYSLHMALKAKREQTKGTMIVDSYFMRDVALANKGDQATVKEYLGNIFVENRPSTPFFCLAFPSK
jgi:hypothetical protein